MTDPERFEVERSARWLFLMSPWLMTALALLGAALPWLPDDGKPRNEACLAGFAALMSIGFGSGAWFAFKIVRHLPEAAISVDADGLWPTVREKSHALVKWTQITHLRERALLQRLEALDSSGSVVARMEYQLQDFQRLRAIVLQRASLERAPASASGVYQRSPWHHAFSIGSMLAFALLGWYVGADDPLIGYGGMAFVVGMIGWEYWTTPFRIRVTPDMLEVHRPWRRQRVPRAGVTRIEIEDEMAKQQRHPRVAVHLADGSKPLHLKGLGLQAVALHQILQAWHRGEPDR